MTLIQLAEKENIEIIEIPMVGNIKGLYADQVIAINKNIETTIEKECILAEELGHHFTSSGDILDQSKMENRKQELKAKRWAVSRLIVVEDFIRAFEARVHNREELAEFLGVTEEFIETAIKHFQNIYGKSHTIENYKIYFDPLGVYREL
jgi:Zn-dependent peptidase ImmA (M78 family)